MVVKLTYKKTYNEAVKATRYSESTGTFLRVDNNEADKLERYLTKQRNMRIESERQKTVQAQVITAQQSFNAEITKIKNQTERFFIEAAGTPEQLATALHIDEQRTLELLEQGLQLELQPTKGVATVKRDGKTYYSVNYRSRSLIHTATEKHRSNRLNRSFSWDDWNKQIKSIAKNRALDLTCLFDSVSDIPKQQKTVNTKLVSFNSNVNSYRKSILVILDCGESW